MVCTCAALNKLNCSVESCVHSMIWGQQRTSTWWLFKVCPFPVERVTIGQAGSLQALAVAYEA